MLKTIELEIEIVTPMFLSGAEQGKAELRAPSIKGLLRYWWRTLQPPLTLDALLKKESLIFGSGGDDQGGGSSFSLRIVSDGLKSTRQKLPKHNIEASSKGKTFPLNILDYLAYGTYTYKKGEGNVFNREWIEPGVKFMLIMTFFKEDYIQDILKTMHVFDLFGCIGSRSRNGFGGFKVISRSGAQKIDRSFFEENSGEDLRVLVKQHDPQPHASFCRGTRLFRSKRSYDTWDKALAEMGKIYRSARTSIENRHEYDKRQYIGAPLMAANKNESFLDRHSKPYFMKVLRHNGQYRFQILYLPSQYVNGLEKDRGNRLLDHNKVDREFLSACDNVNAFLSNEMKVIL